MTDHLLPLRFQGGEGFGSNVPGVMYFYDLGFVVLDRFQRLDRDPQRVILWGWGRGVEGNRKCFGLPGPAKNGLALSAGA
jgi:hypothetical protein